MKESDRIALLILSFLSKRLRVSQVGFRENSGTGAILVSSERNAEHTSYNSSSPKDSTL
jgi:hypothetical protein